MLGIFLSDLPSLALKLPSICRSPGCAAGYAGIVAYAYSGRIVSIGVYFKITVYKHSRSVIRGKCSSFADSNGAADKL